MNKIGILYICTGKYSVFWEDFYKSAESYFLTNTEKHYYIWTDDDSILDLGTKNGKIHCYYQETEEWPFPTLNRFDYFLKQKIDLEKMDYLIFMNANLLVNKTVSEVDVLPRDREELFVTLHPGFYAKSPFDFTYENNAESLAYIEKGKGNYYFAGGLNGGKTASYLKMIECLSTWIKEDYKKGIIAVWHDESHLNKYMYKYSNKYFRMLSPAYLYPEGWNLPFENIITIREKNNFGGHDFLRQTK